MSNALAQRLAWILWPSFLVACAAELAFFALVDPSDLHLFGAPVTLDRMSVYTLGFFAFWALGAASSALTCLLARSPFELNRCPMHAAERPVGCPKRADEISVA